MKKHNGKIIAQTRKSKKMTQIELAEKSGITRQTLINIEQGHGNHTERTMNKLYKQLGITVTVQSSAGTDEE